MVKLIYREFSGLSSDEPESIAGRWISKWGRCCFTSAVNLEESRQLSSSKGILEFLFGKGVKSVERIF